jgi:uncharacterized protein CbrC (UPF0167 family)
MTSVWTQEEWLQKKSNLAAFLTSLNSRISNDELAKNIEKLNNYNLAQTFVAFGTVKDLVADFERNYNEICQNYGISRMPSKTTKKTS